jgi:FHA domain
MSLIGLDLNATRARTVYGPAGAYPAPLRLDDDQREMVLALSLADRKAVVGRAGTRLCRQQPELVCLDFLAHLTTNRRWTAGRHNLDASAALGLVFERLLKSFVRSQGVAMALPAYLNDAQINLITHLADKVRLQPIGSLSTPLAAARWAYQRKPWTGVALVGDVDGHALTWSAVSTEGGQARVLEVQSFPRLCRSAWLLRLLDSVADRCIRLSRRDPRQVAETEQALFDQLSTLLETPLGGGLVEMNLRTAAWSQHLLFQPAELVTSCAALIQQAVLRMRDLLNALPVHAPAQVVLLTASAGCLPGLASALNTAFENLRPTDAGRDFGEGLLMDNAMLAGDVQVLDADAVAGGAHELAGQIQRNEQMPGHADCVRLPAPAPVDDGPARLEFRGKEHQLSGSKFSLGRDPGCNLVFEAELYPTVAPCHCDIILDRRVYSLHDRSRQGTLVNDRLVPRVVALHSGDWIRLGPDGPVLRFLGQASGLRPFRDEA